MRIIRRTLDLANQPPLSDEVLESRAESWAETLFNAVPEERLAEAFKRAIADHDSTFPMSAYELKTAYEKIAEAERTAYSRARQKDLEDLERQNLTANYRECRDCFSTGWKYVKRSDPSGLIHNGVIKCTICNYWWLVSERLASKTEDKLPGKSTRSYQE